MINPESKPQNAPPNGVVTLLFTDIAGSSRLWEQHGDRFIPVWQAHDALMRDSIRRFGGYEVKSEGDAFMVAFPTASAALHCAIFAQAALARYPWPPDVGRPYVRMGLHTGEPFVHGNDYFGPTVNRAAHICAAGHGGQILLSEETRRALDASTDSKIQFTDLGDWRLKDMGAPQHLFQADHPSVESHVFPPPRSLESQPNNLPIQRTSFVGRAREIEQIASYLASGEKPVLTLTGPGGIGKTRLSLQAAAAKAEWFPDGVWYVRLVEAQDVVGAAVEIAAAMNIPLDPNRPALPQVQAWLANRRCLLILDDANTIPQVDRLIRELLSGSNSLRCLATARESLQIDEAEEIAVTGLPVEMEQEETPVREAAESSLTRSLEVTDAERLFLERLATVNPDLKLTPAEIDAVEQLTRELEGVPVSIERAAQLMDRVPPSVVLEWLNHRLAPDRVPPKALNAEKFKEILRRGAQRVRYTMEETTKTSLGSLGQLLQGIANVATDRRDAQQATEVGRDALRLSQEAGDTLGMAAALRQLARVKWQQGDRQSAAAMLTAAAQIYRRHNSEEYPDIQRELDMVHAQLRESNLTLPLDPGLERALALALEDKA